MKELLNNVFSSARWFIGALVVVIIIATIIWSAIDHQGFIMRVNDLLAGLVALGQMVLRVVLIGIGLLIVYKSIVRKK